MEALVITSVIINYYIMNSRFVGADHVPDDRPAERALASTLAPPLLQGAFVAHAHVSAHVEHSVDRVLVADGALGPRRRCGSVLLCPTYRC